MLHRPKIVRAVVQLPLTALKIACSQIDGAAVTAADGVTIAEGMSPEDSTLAEIGGSTRAADGLDEPGSLVEFGDLRTSTNQPRAESAAPMRTSSTASQTYRKRLPGPCK